MLQIAAASSATRDVLPPRGPGIKNSCKYTVKLEDPIVNIRQGAGAFW